MNGPLTRFSFPDAIPVVVPCKVFWDFRGQRRHRIFSRILKVAFIKRFAVSGAVRTVITSTHVGSGRRRPPKEEEEQKGAERSVRPRRGDNSTSVRSASHRPGAMTQSFDPETEAQRQEDQHLRGMRHAHHPQGRSRMDEGVEARNTAFTRSRLGDEHGGRHDNAEDVGAFGEELDPMLDSITDTRASGVAHTARNLDGYSVATSITNRVSEVSDLHSRRPSSLRTSIQPSCPTPGLNENDNESMGKNANDTAGSEALGPSVSLSPCRTSWPVSGDGATPYFEGMLLEALDSVDVWCEAEVIGVNTASRHVRVTYLYWSDKYDEDIPLFSTRLAPYPTHTFQPGRPETLQVRQRVEVEVEGADQARKWVHAEVKGVSGDGRQVLVACKGRGRLEEWLPRDSARIRAYGRFKKCLAAKQSRYGKAALAATTGSHVVNGEVHAGLKRPPLRLVGGSNQHYPQPPQSRSQTRVDLNDLHRRAIAASSDRYSAYQAALSRHGLSIQPIEGDGNCLFRSVSHQVYGTDAHHMLIRDKCMAYMDLERQYFEPYVVGGMSEFLRYLELKRRDGVWGDDPEVQALCEMYDRPAEIWAFDAAEGAKKLRTFHEASGFTGRSMAPGGSAPMRLSYYGGGHYDSLVRVGGRDGGEAGGGEVPGMVENRALEMAQQRQAASTGRGAFGMEESKQRSDQEATEEAAVEAALKASREDFDSFTDLETALELSAEAHLQAELMRSAVASTEEELVKKVLEDSLKGSDGEQGPSTEEEMVRVAMKKSLAEGGLARDEGAAAEAATMVDHEYQEALTLSMSGVGADAGRQGEAVDFGELVEDGELARAIALSLKHIQGQDQSLQEDNYCVEEDHGASFLSMSPAPASSSPPVAADSFGSGASVEDAYLREQHENLEQARARKEEADLQRAVEASLGQQYCSDGRGPDN